MYILLKKIKEQNVFKKHEKCYQLSLYMYS